MPDKSDSRKQRMLKKVQRETRAEYEAARLDLTRRADHNSEDGGLIEKIAIHLADRSKLRPWCDGWEMIPGETSIKQLGRGFGASKTCAVFVGPSGEDPWQKKEVETLLRKQMEDPGFRVIPVLLPWAPGKLDVPTFSTCADDAIKVIPNFVEPMSNRIFQLLDPVGVTSKENESVFENSGALAAVFQNGPRFLARRTVHLAFGVWVLRPKNDQTRLSFVRYVAAARAGVHTMKITTGSSLLPKTFYDLIDYIVLMDLLGPVLGRRVTVGWVECQ